MDLLSDYDVILALRDICPYHEERALLEAFGPVLALFRDPLIPARGFVATTRRVSTPLKDSATRRGVCPWVG